MLILRKKQIDAALDKEYRQYLTGHLGLPQILDHYEEDAEIGMSYYKEFTADKPHMHPICTEHAYVLEGALRILLLDGSKKEYEFLPGDFFALEPDVPYAGKNKAGTRILFIKTPGANDKTLVEPDAYTLQWLSQWDT